MPADAGPSAPQSVKQEQPGSICTPDQLYMHVVGSYPSPEAFGYPGDHDSHGQSPIARSRADDNEDAAGASARAKKRRKTQRRAKVSEIWFPKAEMAFCTSVACIPPNGRTKIKFFGRPLGRNELIAAICTLATRRLYNRKQISSHSQVLKDKVPSFFKEMFTFEDKSRAGEEPGETSTANVIENFPFPDPIYNIIGYRVGTDLANSPKPPWLLDLESGVTEAQTPMTEAGGPRGAGGYSYWNSPSEYSSWNYDRAGGSSHRKDPYYYGQHGGSGRQQGPYGNQLHTLPPLTLPRDMDAQSPVTTSPSTLGDPMSGGRYPYGSMSGRSQYGDVGRSPPTSTSPYDTSVFPQRSAASVKSAVARQCSQPDGQRVRLALVVNRTFMELFRERYPFLEQIASSPGVSVFHVDVYFSLPGDWNIQSSLFERLSDMTVDLSLRPPSSSETSGWSLVTDYSYIHPTGHARYPRTTNELRPNDSGDLAGAAQVSELARLFQYLYSDQGRDIGSLATIGTPNLAMMQAVVRDGAGTVPPHHQVALPPLGTDWNLASTLVIYTFWSPDPETARQMMPLQCRPVDFGTPAPPLPPVDIGADPLVAGLLVGEDNQPSKFDWMSAE